MGNWNDVVGKLYHIAWDQILNFTNKEWAIREYHEHLNPVDYLGRPKDEGDWNTRLARACLHTLRFTTKDEWPFELGEADDSILPLSEERKRKLAELKEV